MARPDLRLLLLALAACAAPSAASTSAATAASTAATTDASATSTSSTSTTTTTAATTDETTTTTAASSSTSSTATASSSSSTTDASTTAATTGTVDPDDCSTNPIPWCTVDTKPAPNGVPTPPPGLGGSPSGMARVDAFCIDRWEAALVEVLPGDTLAPWSPYQSPAGANVRSVSAPGLVPQGYITQVEALAACQAAGKRLCTDGEWLRACRGAADHIFPYGDMLAPGTCNDARTCHPAIQYFETTADWIWSELGHPCLNQLPAGLALTGQSPGCVSDDGIFDMMGNLHEWTADPAGTFRGGYYVDTELNGPGCLYVTTAHAVNHWDYSTGFRCCAD